jgi:ABC-type Na+ efflux pump permease subunit
MDAAIRKAVQAELKKQYEVVDPDLVEEIVSRLTTLGYVIDAIFIGLGVLLTFLGIYVKDFPRAATVTGLIVFTGYNVLVALAMPMGIMALWPLKLVIFVLLIEGVRGAFAYHKKILENQLLAS